MLEDNITRISQPESLPSSSLVLGKIASTNAAPGERIGPYQVLGTLGEGGFGVVYLAEQREPVRRRVALKIIKMGMDTKQVIARFEAERQALALMNHPNVAKVFDAGCTETGRPYFAMEHVPGVPITDHCDRHRLGIRDRLDLFIHVCEAVQHAHQKGIIHRDIKPTNVLVTVKEGRAVPVVIDFGVAKALNSPLTDKTVFTQLGQLIGTPAYMSPEQAEMSAQDIDTRTDIYSLGVMLYELLAGALPFDPKTLRRAALMEIHRIIREVDPPKPSTKLSSLNEQAATPIAQPEEQPTSVAEIARYRHTDARTLLRALRGDLDWITMKAIEKDRTRRYATAIDLAADLARYLAHEPVLAGPPSASYRVRKFVRRHRLPVLAVSAVALALVLGVLATSWMAAVAAQERDTAVEAQRRAELAEAAEAAQKRIAQQRLDYADELVDDLLEINDMLSDLPGALPARQFLLEINTQHLALLQKEGGSGIEFEMDIATQHRRIGQLLSGIRGPNLNETARARQELDAALQIHQKWRQTEPANLDNLRGLALAFLAIGDLLHKDSQQTAALDHYRRSLEHLETLASAKPADAEVNRLLAIASLKLGDLLRQTNDADAAAVAYDRSVKLFQGAVDRDPADDKAGRDLTVGQTRLMRLLQERGDFNDALQLAKQVLTTRKTLADRKPESNTRHRDVMNAHRYLAMLHSQLKDRQSAVNELEQALQIATDLAERSPEDQRAREDLAEVRNLYGRALHNNGESPKGEQQIRAALLAYTSLAADFPDDPDYPKKVAELTALFAGNSPQ